MTYVHINRARGKYIGQVRLFGHKRWTTVIEGCRTAEQAMAAAVMFMGPDHHRARVAFMDDSGYYEPTICMECKR